MSEEKEETLLDKKIGKQIAQGRIQAELTQQQLATMLGISQASLANYEAGRRPLRAAMLYRIAQALGTSPAALLIDPPEAAGIVNQIANNLERTLQIQYMLDVLTTSSQ